ncbi:MAG: hypothetical protein R3F59_17445 [Myxococcota bacterium]
MHRAWLLAPLVAGCDLFPPTSPPTTDTDTALVTTATAPCVQEALAPEDALADGETVADRLAAIPPTVTVTPDWFDGRAVPVTVDVAWVGGTLLGSPTNGVCPLRVETDVDLASDDGLAAGHAGLVSVGRDPSVEARFDLPEDVVAGFDPAPLHPDGCTDGIYVLIMSGTTSWSSGALWHECTLTFRTATGTSAVDTGTGPPRDTAVLFTWN